MGKFVNRLWEKEREDAVRHWYRWLAVAILLGVGLPFVHHESAIGLAVFGLGAVITAFEAGFYYNNRLRQKRQAKGFMPTLATAGVRKPDERAV